ncbi:MAG: hypothetical protein ACYDB9_05210 [Gammaproteobacteria bacterium]
MKDHLKMISKQTVELHRLGRSLWLDRGRHAHSTPPDIVKALRFTEAGTGTGDADARDILCVEPFIAPFALNQYSAWRNVAGVRDPGQVGKTMAFDGDATSGIACCEAPNMAIGSLGKGSQRVATAVSAKSRRDPPATVSRETGASS